MTHKIADWQPRYDWMRPLMVCGVRTDRVNTAEQPTCPYCQKQS